MTGTPRVVIADDQALVRTGFRLILGEDGINVVAEAANGTDAVDAVRRTRPDVVLMDIRMPGMDGLEATSQLRNAPHTAGLPVIMVSANAAAEDERRGLAAGAVAFLPKPVDRTRLITLLTEHLNLHWLAPP
jgi:CheY-like chemotaxis protein